MKTLITFLALIFALQISAQEDMPAMWETKLEHSIDFYGCDNVDSDEYSYAASQKKISVINNSTGNVIWTKAFKEIAPRLRKIDEIITIWDAQKIFLLDLKMGKEQIAVIDMLSGELEWESDQYKLKKREMISYIKEEKGFMFTFKDINLFVDAETGAELWSTQKFKGTIGKYFYKDGFLTTVNFVPSGFMAMFTGFKNQIAKINMKTGEIVWENTYVGRAAKKIVTGEFLYELELRDSYLVLHMNGLQVYDYNTGGEVWSAAFNYGVPVKAPGNAVKFGVYGAIAAPVFTDTHIYVVDMSGKKQQYIHKYQRVTGKHVWTSQEISGGAKVVPNLYVVDGKVILQIGGIVEIQGVFKETSTDSNGNKVVKYVKKVYDQKVKPYGVQAYSEEDGRLIWDSEKFKAGITNMYLHNEENLIVSSGKALYSMKVHDGAVNYEVDAKNGGVGNVVQILDYADMIVVVGEKGVSTFNVNDGKLIAANKYKRASVVDFSENMLILETAKNDVAAFDVADDCKFWSYNAKKGSGNTLTTDGKHLYVFEKKSVTRLHTRSD